MGKNKKSKNDFNYDAWLLQLLTDLLIGIILLIIDKLTK